MHANVIYKLFLKERMRMSIIFNPLSLEKWLSDVRLYISEKALEILPILDIYIGEAKFGRQFLNQDLSRLLPEAEILEVGAGSMLLSCQLVREGFNVTSLEPIGYGFSHFRRMQELILEVAGFHQCIPKIINEAVEKLVVQNHFDYAFSINVMEHVDNVALALSQVGYSLKQDAFYRFTCPNYLFPYEPHFNCLTLFSKPLTEKIFRKKIFENQAIFDPKGTWESLNWINVLQIKRNVKQLPVLSVSFNRKLLISTLNRIGTDIEFANRRSKWIRYCIKVLIKFRIHYLFGFIPALFRPIIDCKIQRVKV